MVPWYRQVPGFGVGQRWRQVLAAIGYLIIALFIIQGIADPNGAKLIFGLFALPVVILASNAWGLRSRVPLLGSANKAQAAAGWAVLTLAAFAGIVATTPTSPRPPATAVSPTSTVPPVATATTIVVAAQPTDTVVPPTPASAPPTATTVLPTATLVPPTSTPVPATATAIPPTVPPAPEPIIAPPPTPEPAPAPPQPAAKPGVSPEVQAYLNYMQPRIQSGGQALGLLSQQSTRLAANPALLQDPTFKVQTALVLVTLRRAGMEMQSYESVPRLQSR